MSHVADCDIKVKDLDAFRQALKHFGGELVLGQRTHKWYGKFMNDWSDDRAAVKRRDPATFGKCDHAVKFPGIHYEVGLVREADGSYTPVFDEYGGYGEHDGQKLVALLGASAMKLKDEYAAAVTTRLLARQGFRVTRSVDAKTGEILLKARN